ncbi:VanZ family protein [Halosquirtibacter xylanolyticus]|uniref:VanZ family protein n=1 Tax=Halosquirtibacter xylanolyticus TaxID=3374599 RepID=UPI0037497FEE|nr:VanZ family protein [Prolixibacteraceae bacterium]
MIKLIDISIKYAKYFFVLWCGIILYGCLMPSNEVPNVRIPNIDKIVHMVFYIGFTYLLSAVSYKKWKKRFTLLIAISFGIGIEVIQGLLPFERSPSFADAAANTIGAIIGIILFKILYKKSQLSKS